MAENALKARELDLSSTSDGTRQEVLTVECSGCSCTCSCRSWILLRLVCSPQNTCLVRRQRLEEENLGWRKPSQSCPLALMLQTKQQEVCSLHITFGVTDEDTWGSVLWTCYLARTPSSSAARAWDTGRRGSSPQPGCSRVCRSSQSCLRDTPPKLRCSIQSGHTGLLTSCKHFPLAWAVGRNVDISRWIWVPTCASGWVFLCQCFTCTRFSTRSDSEDGSQSVSCV